MADDALRVEIDGEGVEPETVDARAVLELTSAYLDLLSSISVEPLSFRGLKVENKCMSLASWPSSIDLAMDAVLDAEYLLGGKSDPHRHRKMVQRVHAARRALPEGQHARVLLRDLSHPIGDDGPGSECTASALTSLRATILRVGGMAPRVTFRSGSEAASFSLAVGRDRARELGAMLYQEVDIVARVVRGVDDGRIRSGELEEVHEVEGGDALAAWSQWFQANAAAEWSDVHDIEGALRALDDDDEESA